MGERRRIHGFEWTSGYREAAPEPHQSTHFRVGSMPPPLPEPFPARGLALGILCGLALWAVIIGVAFLVAKQAGWL